jgi:gas vesicle protein
MYVVLEYLTYLLGVLVVGGLIFGATVLLMLAESGAERLSKATRKITAQARLLAAEKLTPGSFPGHSPPET